MLEGLEAVEIRLSKVVNEVETLRIDSDYFAKEYLEIEKTILQKSNFFTKFDNLKLLVDGSAFYPALEPFYGEGNYPFLRVGDVKEHIDYENCIKIPFNILGNYPTLKNVKTGDILLTKGGTIAKCGLVEDDACVSRDLIFINSSILNQEDYISLYLYFSSQFAYKQLVRSSSQSVQPHLTITLVRNLDIAIFSNEFKKYLTQLYLKCKECSYHSQTLYRQAEDLLLEELGLKNWQPSTQNTAEKTFNSSFLQSGRLDAEYYQVKYDKLEEKIKNYKNGCNLLSDFIDKYSTGFPFESNSYTNEGMNLIRITNIKKGYLDIENCNKISDEDVKMSLKDIISENDLLISMSGTIGVCCKVRKSDTGIINQRILKFSVRDYDPNVLCLIINSILCKEQFERVGTGGVQTNLSIKDIFQVIIPILLKETQEKIAAKIQESFALKTRSKQLLETAKRGVEIAIEQDEAAALAWMEAEMGE